MTLQVLLNGLPWLQCEEGSFLHCVLLDEAKRQRTRESQRLLALLTNVKRARSSTPKPKDILTVSRILQ